MKQIQISKKKGTYQQTFPGRDQITRDSQEPFMTYVSTEKANDMEIDDYMFTRTNVKPGHIDDARKRMDKKHKNIYKN